MSSQNQELQAFPLLSLREERKLNTADLEAYYARLREYILSRPLKTTTKGALTLAPKLKKYVNRLDYHVTNLLAGAKVERITDGLENIPEGPVLFANTHQGILDNLCWIPSCPRHCVILHASDVSKALIAAQLCTGLVLVSKEEDDAQNRQDAKLDMIRILLEGHCVWYFPEGTWNLTPSRPHLPMSFGFLDVAKKSGAPVVPVVTEFTYDTGTDKERITKMHIRYGRPIYVSIQDNLTEKLEEYSAAISTLRWELFEEKGLFSRKTVTNQDYINYLKGNYRNLELGHKNWELEKRRMRGADDPFYLFHHINDIPFDENGNWLDTEEVRRLQIIAQKHGI